MKIIERKSTLAKLLAKENITVTHGNMHTAYFDVKNRVLGLPVWKDRGAAVYDMLIGHEVGHALYTPEDAFERYAAACGGSAPFDLCNVVEDIRIERLIKAAYPGLPRLFNEAYGDLVENDFFGVADKDIASLKFIDRLNLRGKVGDLIEVPLDEKEESIYSRCLAAETFDEVLEICKDILDSKGDEDESSEDDESESDSEEGSSDESNDELGDDETNEDEADDGEEAESNSSDDEETEEESLTTDASSDDIKSEDGEEKEQENANSDTTANGEANQDEPTPNDDEFTSDTQQNFDKSMSDEVETPKSQGITPVMLPRRSYIKEHIISYKELAAQRKPTDASIKMHTDILNGNRGKDLKPLTFDVDFAQEYVALKKKTTKKVGTLVREFERRKSAYQYSRAKTSRSGALDMNKLHGYKVTDQIFSSKTFLADAKSHGMIFLIDYSGSMATVLADVIEQTLNLVEFCKKVGIPFEVYSFTSGYYGRYKNGDTEPTFDEVDLKDVILINLLSSDLKKADYNEGVKNLWAQHWFHKQNLGKIAEGIASPFERLGGTPLDTVLTMMHTIVNDFITKHRVQKTMFVTLTDGDSHKIDSNTAPGDLTYKSQVKANGKTYSFHRANSTPELTKMIGDIPTVETIGFFITNPWNAKYEVRNRIGYNHTPKDVKDIRKNGFKEFSNVQGYESYFILLSDLKIEDEDFDYETDEDIADSRKAQTKLAKTFSKHNSSNKKARVLMTAIAEKVA